MLNAIEHFSRIRLENTTLQVMADRQRDLDRLIHEEEAVIRHYARLGSWPHESVNLFVLEDLRPLVAQIKGAAVAASVVADDIDRRPMVIIYDVAALTECTIFVNRGALERDGSWKDGGALRALLAHEHAHPLAENRTVHAARTLSIATGGADGADRAAVEPILHLLADRLCLHAPQEVFANEIAMRAGFADALLHLDRDAVEKACAGVGTRSALVQGLDAQVAGGKLSAGQAAALLLVGDLQAHLVFAMETAAFLRVGRQHEAAVLEARLDEGVWAFLDPVARRLYMALRDHYCGLQTDFGPAAMKAWAERAAALLVDALSEKSLSIRLDIVRAPADGKHNGRPAHPKAEADKVLHRGSLP